MEKRERLDIGTHVISESGNRREVVVIARDENPGRHGKHTSVTYHEHRVGSQWLPSVVHTARRVSLAVTAMKALREVDA